MVNIQSPAAEIRRGKKEEGRTNHSMKIYMVSLLHRATINSTAGRYAAVFSKPTVYNTVTFNTANIYVIPVYRASLCRSSPGCKCVRKHGINCNGVVDLFVEYR